MDIKVSGRKTTVTDALRAHVDEKIGEALKVFDIEPMSRRSSALRIWPTCCCPRRTTTCSSARRSSMSPR